MCETPEIGVEITPEMVEVRMDWKAFFASAISSLAWPAVVVTLLILLRNQLSGLAQRLEELTLPGGAKAKFRQQLDEARRQAEETALPGVRPPAITGDDPYVDLATKYPEAAVLQSYKEVEEALLSYNQPALYPNAKRHNPNQMVDILHRYELVDSDVVALFRKVRDTRNAAVHAGARTITPGEALEYRSLCQSLATTLRAAIARIPELWRLYT